jgi:hypothetical protein
MIYAGGFILSNAQGFTLHRKSPSLSKSVFGKKEECVKSADGMELLRRMMMAYGGMFPCLILLLFHGIHSHWICGMMPSSFGMELN